MLLAPFNRQDRMSYYFVFLSLLVLVNFMTGKWHHYFKRGFSVIVTYRVSQNDCRIRFFCFTKYVINCLMGAIKSIINICKLLCRSSFEKVLSICIVSFQKHWDDTIAEVPNLGYANSVPQVGGYTQGWIKVVRGHSTSPGKPCYY